MNRPHGTLMAIVNASHRVSSGAIRESPHCQRLASRFIGGDS
jgi:hypothetical protein